MARSVAVVFIVVVFACGSTAQHEKRFSGRSSVERFVKVLERGDFVYGLGAGCDGWRAGPEKAYLDIQAELGVDESVVEEDDPAGIDGAPQESWFLSGRLTARPDAVGRIYGFGYELEWEKGVLRMAIYGRGGWSPAPEVGTLDEKNYGLIGVAKMCFVRVDVRAHPSIWDAIMVGNETWYLSRDVCLRARRSEMPSGAEGCSTIQGPRTPQ